MAGRQSHNLARSLLKATPVVLSKAGTLTAAAFGGRYYNTQNVPLEIVRIHASVGTAPTGASLIFDVKINGTTVFAQTADRPTITATNFATAAAGVPATKTGDNIRLLPGQYLTVEATQVGSSVAGADANVQVFLG